jgi:L-ascorbate metabolism protein UlaG (beta-lactamase superfamily)
MGRAWGRGRLPAAGALSLFALAFAGWTGWYATPGDWRRATGWQEIPVDRRPAPGELWPATAGQEPPTVEWLGHSGFRLRWAGATLLLDPNLSDRCTVSRRVMAAPLAAADLGEVDGVLISHAHFDHMDLPTLLAVPRIGAVVLPRGSDAYLPDSLRRSSRIVGLAAGESSRVGPLEVYAVAAAHNGNRLHPLHGSKAALGYVVRTGGQALYFAGDTGRDNEFAGIRETFHPRVAILPIGAYAPRFPMKYYHLSPEEAVEVARDLDVETVVPCHFGTFTLSLDRPSQALPRFARAAALEGLRWLMPQPPGGFDPSAPPGVEEP